MIPISKINETSRDTLYPGVVSLGLLESDFVMVLLEEFGFKRQEDFSFQAIVETLASNQFQPFPYRG